MDELKTVLQFMAILFICFLLVESFKILVAYMRRKRIIDFSINLNDYSTNDSLVFKLIFKTTKVLESLVIFNGLGRTYDSYVDSNSRLKKGLDYVSIKLYVGILFILMYVFLIFLNKQDIDVTILCVVFILGYIIPDFYCIYISNKNNRLTNHDIMEAVIIMSNSYKVGRSTEQAISDVISSTKGRINKEFRRVLSDIKIGISPQEAFKRMYYRTYNRNILDISNLLYSINKSGVSASQVFYEVEKRLINQEKFVDKIYSLHNINLLMFILFAFLPLLFIIYIIFFRLDFILLATNSCGGIVLIILFILYLLYSFIIWKIAKEVK